MKFKVDENLPGDLAEELRAVGHNADTVFDEGLAGASDQDVVAAARAEERVLLTLDKGIADIVQYPAGSHRGVVLFRPGSVGRQEVLRFVRDRLPELLSIELLDHVTVVTASRIRRR